MQAISNPRAPRGRLVLRTLGVAAVAATLALSSAGAAQEADPDVPKATDLGGLLEAWQGATRPTELSLAEHVSEHYPEWLSAWTDQAAGSLGGPLVAVYEDLRPEWLEAFRSDYLESSDDGVAEGDDGSFVDYLVHYQPEWLAQVERDLTELGEGQDLETFIGKNDPEVITELEMRNDSFYAEPIGFIEWVTTYTNDPVALGQAHSYVNDILDGDGSTGSSSTGGASTCTCRIIASGVELPGSQVDVHNPNYEDKRNNGTWKEWRHGYLTQRGAAQRLGTSRFIRNTDNQLSMNNVASSATISFRMSCTRPSGNDVVQCDQGIGCSADVKVKSKFSSAFEVYNDATRAYPWHSISSSATAANVGVLKMNPGSANESVLFEKGLALERTYNTSASAGSVLAGIKSAYNLYQTIDNAGGDVGAILTNIDDQDVQNILGIATVDGSRGTSNQNLHVQYSNAGAAPFVISNGEEAVFEISSIAKAESIGNGKTSDGRTRSSNSYFLVGVANNFSCTGAAPPKTTAAWTYNSVWQAPFSAASARGAAEGFIYSQTGTQVSAPGYAGHWTAP